MSEGTEDALPDEEKLSRFVLKKEWIRQPTDSYPFISIKHDAFFPPKDLQLSVSRHSGLSEDELNKIGLSVAQQTQKPLLGRGDIKAHTVSKLALKAVAAPLRDNPNHAHIIGWPIDKEARITLAQKIAAEASFVPI
jgi:hypothetical protein